MLRGVIAGVLDSAIAFKPQSKKVVVLANDLTRWTRKIQRKGRHVAAEVVDAKNQILRQVRVIAPYHPAHPERRQPEFVTRRVDRFDSRQAKIPHRSEER